MIGRRLRPLSGVAMIDIGQVHAIAGSLWHGISQRGHGGAIIGVGRCDLQREPDREQL